MKKSAVLLVWIVLFFSPLQSCKTKNFNYVDYYNEVHVIDSIYRYHKDTLTIIRKYKNLFRKYGSHNQERLREFETYILLSHYKNKKFGGKKSLYKLIDLITPYKERYTDYSFFKKYRIDSIEVAKRFKKREEKYNKILIDSFRIANLRDQITRKIEYNNETRKADLQNINLFKWTIQNYGFPSTEKVGSVDKYYARAYYDIMFIHFHDYEEEYQFLEKEFLKYVKSGECNPYSYAAMVDRHYVLHVDKTKSLYNVWPAFHEEKHLDTLRININRKKIGLPSLKHTRLIPTDRLQILKLK